MGDPDLGGSIRAGPDLCDLALDFEDEVRRTFRGTMSVINFSKGRICNTWIRTIYSNWSPNTTQSYQLSQL